MMIHRIRVGLGLDEDVGGSEEFQRLAAGLTPVRLELVLLKLQA